MPEKKISAEQVKEIREKTGAPVMDCKQALTESEGDLERAVALLRERGLAKARKRMEKVARQGVVESYVHIGGQIGALVEVNCETDFVARGSEFQDLAHQVALQVVACNPLYLNRESVPPEVVDAEKSVYRSRCEAEGKPEKVWDRIIEGMLEKYFQEVCLLDHPFIKDPSMTVGELVAQFSGQTGEKVEIRRFSRFQVGEE